MNAGNGMPTRDKAAEQAITGRTCGSPATGRTVFRTCTLCEACCGLRFEVAGDRITAVRPDDDDVLSRGFVCPKGVAIADVHPDPDRIRQPLVRGSDGVLRPASWE